MSTIDHRALPLDPRSAEALASRGLGYTLVDTGDADLFDGWLLAEARGFHDETADEGRLASLRSALAYRRTTAVTDPSAPDADSPVGTVSSWVTPLTVSPGRTVDAWAISAVSVRPTHAGRGIARAMLEGELRTAADAGVPLAALTVSESTLYGRYGFAPAAMTSDWTIRTSRVRWSGPVPAGRVDLITPREWRDAVHGLYERVRLRNAGHIEAWGRRWDEMAGLVGEDPERAKRLRAARYLDEDGQLRGLLLYRVVEGGGEFTDHRLTVEHLTTETADASAALWRLAVTMPLVSEVSAALRRTDEAVRWQIGDFRAAKESSRDNLWLRILDVPASLSARSFASPGRLGLRVTDALGHASGDYLLAVDEQGAPTVTRGLDGAGSAPVLELDVADLSALLLGGVRVATLAEAGRVSGTEGAVAHADALFRAAAEPWLPFWF